MKELLANHANLGSYNDKHYQRLSGSAKIGEKPGSSTVHGVTYTMETEKKEMFYLIFKTYEIAYWKTLKLIDQKMRASGSFLRFIMLEKLNKETT